MFGEFLLKRHPQNCPKGPNIIHWIKYQQQTNHDLLKIYRLCQAQFGDIFSIPFSKKTYNCAHPDHALHILKTNRDNYYRGGIAVDRTQMIFGNSSIVANDTDWKNKRAHIQGGFNNQFLKKYAEIINQEMIPAWIQRWRNFAKDEKKINLTKEMNYLSLQIAARCFQTEPFSPSNQWLTVNMVKTGNPFLAKNAFLGKWTPSLQNIIFHFLLNRYHRRLEQIIARRHHTHKDYHDVLNMLLGYSANLPETSLSVQAQRDELKLLLITGQATTACALVWAWIEMLSNPHIEQNLYDEVKDLNLTDMDDDTLPELPYTKAVVQESLRHYPPLWNIQRHTKEADELSGFYIPEKACLNLNFYAIHHHPEFWDAPDIFEPQRFLNQSYKKKHPFCFIPFSLGPQICIAHRFALIEAQMILSRFMQVFKINLITPPPFTPEPILTLAPPDPIMATIELRNA